MNEQAQEDPPDDSDHELSGAPPRPAERAAFLDDFPDSPELTPLVQAFEAGNYAKLRLLEQSLRQRCQDPDILDPARELVERTDADPTAKVLLFLSIGFFLFILIWVYGNHGH